MIERRVIFSHGLEGSPTGPKIQVMAKVAKALGCQVESLDYRGLTPEARVTKLLAFAKAGPASPILVGSSLGGHVATAASRDLQAAGLFLLAPAFYMPGYEQYTPLPAACPITILHGWHDTVVPVDNSCRYAREHQATLMLLNSDHRLLDCLPMIATQFRVFLHSIIDAATHT